MNVPGIVYVTCCANGYYGLQRLLRRGTPVSLVVSLAPHVGKQCNVSGYVDVKRLLGGQAPVLELQNYCLSPEDLHGVDCDLLVVNGWNRLISQDVIKLFRLGGLAIHAGHPPLGHGRAPLPWNIIKGRSDIEVYVFRMTERADDGDIVARAPVEITAHDDVGLLYEKVMFQGARLFERAISDMLHGTARYTPQALDASTTFPKRTPEDGLINFSMTCGEIVNFVRAQSRPYPGAFALLDDYKATVWKAVPFDCFAFRDVPRNPGQILAALPSGLVVATGTSAVWLLEAEAEGWTIPAPLEDLERLVGKVFTWKKRDTC